jgi:hypothetical protein
LSKYFLEKGHFWVTCFPLLEREEFPSQFRKEQAMPFGLVVALVMMIVISLFGGCVS